MNHGKSWKPSKFKAYGETPSPSLTDNKMDKRQTMQGSYCVLMGLFYSKLCSNYISFAQILARGMVFYLFWCEPINRHPKSILLTTSEGLT